MSSENKMSKRQMIKAKRQRQQRNSKLILIVPVMFIAAVVAFALIYSTLRVNKSFASRPNANDNAMGNPNAPITITEFSDYRCSHCGTFATQIEPLLVEEYVESGDVKFVYRSMGGWLSEQSLIAAEASYCAGEENKFWEYHDIIFTNPGIIIDNRQLNSWAKIVELDESGFKQCMKERRYQDRAEQDALEGSELGVTGTPTFFLSYEVNGVEQTRPPIQGAQPFEVFQQEIQAALAEIESN